MMLTSLSMCVLFAVAAADEPLLSPVPRPVLRELVRTWDFDGESGGWQAEHACRLSVEEGLLRIENTGEDPYFHCRVDGVKGQWRVQVRLRSRDEGQGALYWATAASPRSQRQVRGFSWPTDGEWHEREIVFPANARLTDIRLDPGNSPGLVEIDWIKLYQEQLHPALLEHVEVLDRSVHFKIRNDSERRLPFEAAEQSFELDPNQSRTIEVPLSADIPLEPVKLEIRSPGLPDMARWLFVYHPDAKGDFHSMPLGDYRLRVDKGGSIATIDRGDQTVAIIAPLVHFDGELPEWQRVDIGSAVRFASDDTTLTITPSGSDINVSIISSRRCRGPVVRVLGQLEQGLLSGLEYLGKGERSSSKLDVETEEHIRFAPDPLDVTLPFMAFASDGVSVGMLWKDTELQPLFATPNFFDMASDHRMALEGKHIEATIHVSDAPLEPLIEWAVQQHGLPLLPPAPRTADEQEALCLKALNGPLRTEQGWGHCVESRWPRQPYADIASAYWRLTGKLPPFDHYVPGGGHVRNEAIFFVTGQVQSWLEHRRGRAESLIAQQGPDGSYRYTGKYRRGHFEDTASGVCARPAWELLEFARLTGDQRALQAGLKTLEYMKRFRTPRGAQVWEIPLHTPDQLASAYLVWAYVLGYELTGREDYLKQAHKWAITGIPFVYLWGKYPVMVYATPPVYGATNWVAPCWIGRPVQWVGGVYAYALARLAPYDDTLDWEHLARGILIAAEQMQYPDGPNAGLLPDAFVLEAQQRVPANINPSAILCLRWRLDGRLDSLAVATAEGRRVVAPFPVTLRGDKAFVQGRAGVAYQILVDGQHVIDVVSRGADEIALP